MAPLTKTTPTHVLTITVPLNMEANPAAEQWGIQEAMRDAMSVIMRLISLGTLGLLCDDINVNLDASSETSSDEQRFSSQIDIDHPSIKAGAEALFGQHPERGGAEREQAVFAVLQASLPYLS